MEFEATCPHCACELEIPSELIGQVIECPGCSKQLLFGDPVAPSVPQAFPASAAPAGPFVIDQTTADGSVSEEDDEDEPKRRKGRRKKSNVGMICLLSGLFLAVVITGIVFIVSKNRARNSVSLAVTKINGVTLNPVGFFNNRVQLLIPAGFARMDQATINERYTMPEKPQVVVCNGDKTVEISLNHSQSTLPSGTSSLRGLEEQMKSILPNNSWIGSDIRSFNGQTWLTVTTRIQAGDRTIQSFASSTSVRNRLFSLVTTCESNQATQWKQVFETVLKSARIDL